MGLDVTAKIIIGYRIKDLVKVEKKDRTLELYDQFTGKSNGKKIKIKEMLFTLPCGKSLLRQSSPDIDIDFGEVCGELFQDVLDGVFGIDIHGVFGIDIHSENCNDITENDLIGMTFLRTSSHRDGAGYIKQFDTSELYKAMNNDAFMALFWLRQPQLFLLNDISY